MGASLQCGRKDECTSPIGEVIHGGYLKKYTSNSVNKRWKQYYFVVSEGLFSYYDDADAAAKEAARNQISLTTAAIRLMPDERFGRPHVFVVLTEVRAFYFAAASADECSHWISTLKAASAQVTESPSPRSSSFAQSIMTPHMDAALAPASPSGSPLSPDSPLADARSESAAEVDELILSGDSASELLSPGAAPSEVLLEEDAASLAVDLPIDATTSQGHNGTIDWNNVYQEAIETGDTSVILQLVSRFSDFTRSHVQRLLTTEHSWSFGEEGILVDAGVVYLLACDEPESVDSEGDDPSTEMSTKALLRRLTSTALLASHCREEKAAGLSIATPLCVMHQMYGRTILARALTPILTLSPVGGLQADGQHIPSEHHLEIDAFLDRLADKLGLGSAVIEGTGVQLKLPWELQTFLGHDSRLYMHHTARFMPPDVSTGLLEPMISQLRPELIRELPVHVSVNAFSGFLEAEEQHNLAVVAAAQTLQHTVLPRFASELREYQISVHDGRSLVIAMHRAGINLRYLGALSQIELPDHLARLVSAEMIGRLLKQELNAQWRAVAYGDISAQREVVVATLNSCFNPDDSDDASWWSECIARGLLERYGCEMQLNQVRQLWRPVLEALCRLCGIQFDLSSISARTGIQRADRICASVSIKVKDIVGIIPRTRSADAMLFIEHGSACEPQAVLKLLTNCGETTEAMRIRLDLAQGALAAGSFDEAIELAEPAISDLDGCALQIQAKMVALLATANRGLDYTTHLDDVEHTLSKLDMTKSHPLACDLQQELGVICASRGDWTGCSVHLKAAIEQFEQGCAEHRKLAQLWLQLAMCSTSQADKAEALRTAVQMADITAKEDGLDEQAAGCIFHCACGLLQLGEPEEAKKWSERALRLVPKGQLMVAKLRTKLQDLISHIDANFSVDTEKQANDDRDSCRSPLSPSKLTNSSPVAKPRQALKGSMCRRDTLDRSTLIDDLLGMLEEIDEE